MASSWRRNVFRGTGALALAVLLGTAVPAHADHADRLLGFMAGGAVGGALGSLIGDGSGRDLAIGIGTTLGAAYGYEAARKAHAGDRWRKKHWRRADRWHRSHARLWGPPVVIERHWAPRTVWRERVVVEPVVIEVPAAPVVQPVVTLPRRQVARGSYAVGRLAPSTRAAAECRTLEDGPLPVYACTDGSGDWWLLD